jgi:hypothetical protein
MVPVIYSIAFAACSDVAGTAGTHATVNLQSCSADDSAKEFRSNIDENIRKADENRLPPGRAEGQPYNRYGPRAFQTGG